MSVEVSLNTPLADALNTAIQPKLVEVGWGTGGSDDAALAEYIILMLVNSKSREQIAAELSGDLLSLPPDDPDVRDFSIWLFDQIELLNAQMNGPPAPEPVVPDDGPSLDSLEAMDTEISFTVEPELNAPTGPRSMRNGHGNGIGNGSTRGGRDKRMLSTLNKAMDRSGDGTLHRTRGNDNRISTHSRAPPAGPRLGAGRPPRQQNNRAASFQAGLPGVNPQAPSWMAQGQPPNQMEIMAMLEQQSQMMFQLSQQMMNNNNARGSGFAQQRQGKSLFDRVSRAQNGKPRNRHNLAPATQESGAGGTGDGNDIDMADSKREPPNPDETVCKYNLHCTNSDCKFAHQSPAAPPGTSVDVNDICGFGAACKNRKCVGRHPSPATKLVHQSEQDCKFYPNCQNPRCPFKHPSMPLCRNGPACSTANCKFTHVKTKCKFNPCLNPHCVFAHEDGQQGGFRDKVWTAKSNDEHVNERKFVDEAAAAEQVKPEDDDRPPPAQATEGADEIG